MFSAHKPLYFVFSGEGEVFFTEGLLQMKLRSFLWYELKRCGYKYIYYLSTGMNGKQIVEIRDRDSFTRNQYGQGIFSRKALWNTKTDQEFSAARITAGRPAAAEWLLYQLTEEQTAVICDIGSLDSLFPKGAGERAAGLIKALRNGRGTLILSSPSEITREELSKYAGKDSLFRQISERASLCVPMYSVITDPEEQPVFEELKRAVPELVRELNCLGRDRLMPMLRQVEFAGNEQWTEAEFYDLLNYLIYWLNNDDVKRDAGSLFSGIQGEMTAAALFQSLTGSGMEAVRERIRVQKMLFRKKHPEETGEITVIKALTAAYGPRPQPEDRSCVRLAEPVLQEAAGLRWPGEFKTCTASSAFLRTEKAEWDRMRQEVVKPRNRKLQDDRLENLKYFVNALRNARMENDPETVCRAGNMIMFTACNLYTQQNEKYADIVKTGTACIDISRKHHENERTLKNLTANGAGHGSGVAYQSQVMLLQAKREEFIHMLRAMDERLIYNGRLPEILSEEVKVFAEGLMSGILPEQERLPEQAEPEREPAADEHKTPEDPDVRIFKDQLSEEDAVKLLHDENIV